MLESIVWWRGVGRGRILPKEFPDLKVKEQDDEGRRVDSTKLRASKL
jgi:hypothetical protein